MPVSLFINMGLPEGISDATAEALYKGVREVFGPRALIQRCRVHKLRNVLEHLPLEKRQQATWRLRGAWAKATPQEALPELRACVKWLDTISCGWQKIRRSRIGVVRVSSVG